MTRRRPSRGFTLIEIMMVVAMIGILSSVALPEFWRLNLRARTAERRAIITAISRAMTDYTLNNPRLPGGTLTGDWNPTGPLSTSKRIFDQTAPGWRLLPLSIEGTTYYSYKFVADDTTSPSTLDVYAAGDLDGDGVASTKQVSYLGLGDAYAYKQESPLEGMEDVGTF